MFIAYACYIKEGTCFIILNYLPRETKDRKMGKQKRESHSEWGHVLKTYLSRNSLSWKSCIGSL